MKLLTVKQLSQIISIKESTLYAWASQTLIPSYKLNGALRFDVNEIEEWIRNSKEENNAKSAPQPKKIRNREVDKIIRKAIVSTKEQSYNRNQKGSQINLALKGVQEWLYITRIIHKIGRESCN